MTAVATRAREALRRQRLWFVPAVLAVMLGFSIVITLQLEGDAAARLDIAAADGRQSLAWAGQQLGTELVRLTDAARRHANGLPPVDGALTDRFDIFVSRLATLQAGDFRRGLVGQDFYEKAMAALRDLVARHDAAMAAAPTPGAARALVDQAEPLYPLVRDLNLGINQVNQAAQDDDGGVFDTLRLRLREAVMVQAVLMVNFAGFIAWALYRKNRTTRALRGANKSLAVERERFIDAIESIPDGFVMFDAADRLVTCNSRFREIYAESADLIVPGAHFSDIVRQGVRRGQYPQAGPDVEAFVAAMHAWHRADGAPMERLLPDGRWIRITERRTAGGGTVGIRTDITALKQAKERAEAGERAKAEFLAVMSHEIRTPLNGVLGMLGLIEPAGLDPEARRRIAIAQGAGEHLLDLVNDILDHSKLEAGRVEFEIAPFSPAEVVAQVATVTAPRAAEQGNVIETDIAADLPPWLAGDRLRLRQILLNLVGNAAKFTTGGRILISVAARPHGDGVMLEIAVSDTGIGIDPDILPRLFEKFSQGDASTTRRFGGTGLGLAISKRLVEAQGGTIGVTSAPGAGARFWFAIPCALAAAPAPADPATAAGRSLEILVAEDNAINREVVSGLLRRAGHHCTLAENGRAAVEAASSALFDAVLMDLEMPELDGLAATRAIRALAGPMARVPIIALTASAHADQDGACRAAGMTGHLSKPIDPARLYAMLAQLGAVAAVPPDPDWLAAGETAGGGAGGSDVDLAAILADLAEFDRRLAS